MRRKWLVLFAALLTGAMGLDAADLRDDTLDAYRDYIQQAQTAALRGGQSRFLWIDGSPENLQRVRAGEIVVAPVGRTPRRVPNGLVHDWIGAAFIPHATLDEVFAIVRDYSRYHDFYGPLVIDSRPFECHPEQCRFELLMANHALFSKSALDGEYSETYTRVGETRWYSIAQSTSMRQIDHYGQADERRLPADEGSGYIWRIFSISRFEERDGGVYVELEAIALSRGIPASLHWFVDPIVRRVARDSLTTSLEKTRVAVSGPAARTTLARLGTAHR
ncbi:MAG TPA: hypothetical protein VFA04_24185 [Bryobacteraceae bacterium]|nr:hypothetical protein [Bryobacteraceae bacterium]